VKAVFETALIRNDQLAHYHHVKRISALWWVGVYTHANGYENIPAGYIKKEGALYFLVEK
jgi:hypothetical protein